MIHLLFSPAATMAGSGACGQTSGILNILAGITEKTCDILK